MNKIVKNTLILTLITVIAGVLLGAYMKLPRLRSHSHRRQPKKKHGRQYFQM